MPTAVDKEIDQLKEKIDFLRLPNHIAIIMDGNGRWAKSRNLPRIEGHRAGTKSVRAAVTIAREIGISNLTLYAFSIENWKRPRSEINELMKLLREYLHKELPTMLKNGIGLRVLGRFEGLPSAVKKDLLKVMQETQHCRDMMLNLALNYGGRAEIIDAVKKIGAEIKANKLNEKKIDESTISDHLYTVGIPDPDLLIRTSGEMRVSNFLLWQIAYSEIWVTPIFWPDFRKKHLLEAIIEYQKRERRFGATSEQLKK